MTTTNKCSDIPDSSKCDLVIDSIHANFGNLIPKSTMVHQNIEVKARCIACNQSYYFTLTDLKVEDFGQIWRTAVFSKQYKPEA